MSFLKISKICYRKIRIKLSYIFFFFLLIYILYVSQNGITQLYKIYTINLKSIGLVFTSNITKKKIVNKNQ